MAETFIDLIHHIFQYDGDSVYVAFHDKTNEPFFHAKQMCKLLEYEKPNDALKRHVKEQNIIQLQNIVSNYKILYKNVQGHTKFLTEAGMYQLILKSKMQKAQEIADWITDIVMPNIRRYGNYHVTNELEEKVEKLTNIIEEKNEVIEKKNEEIGVLRHNMKKQKFGIGECVYIMRTIDDSMKFDKNKTLFVKFGRADNVNTRIPGYNSCVKNRVQIIKVVHVKDCYAIEVCVLARMDEMRIKHKKEILECTYNQIIIEIAKCVKFYEERDIDIEPDIEYELYDDKHMNRNAVSDKFNRNEKMTIKFVNDEFDEVLCDKCKVNSDEENSDEQTNQLLLTQTRVAMVGGNGTNTDNEKSNKSVYRGLKEKYLKLKKIFTVKYW